MNDALGYPIEIGTIYGYSVRNNGIVKVVIGEAESITDNGVRLKIICRGSAAYSGNITEEKINRKFSIVTSNTLFKIESIETNWLKNEVKDRLKN